MHICFICLSLVVSLTETQYLEIEPSGKEVHTNKSMMLKMLFLRGCVRRRKCVWWAIENNYLLVYNLFEIGIKWIPAMRKKAEIIFSSMYLGYFALQLSLLFKLNTFSSLSPFSSGIYNGREKKADQLYVNNYMYIRWFFKDAIYFFCFQNIWNIF